MLPEYQAHHRNYDRFLPRLVRHLEPHSTVIDVGAHCGDSLAAMCVANPALQYLCIEPQETLFQYLTANVERIRDRYPALGVLTVQSLIGKDVKEASLVSGDSGTYVAQLTGDERMKSRTLDEVARSSGVTHAALIKSDVDGFDYDVIGSAENLIQESSPILFFEWDHAHDFQRIGYERLLLDLKRRGYLFTVFDNFGGLVFPSIEPKTLFQFLAYIASQAAGQTTRTIYYCDILAFTARDESLVQRAVVDHRAA
jgi:FkbM family methyltransferase